MYDNSDPTTLDYERKATRPWWLHPAAVWSGASLLLAAGCLPLGVALTAIVEDWIQFRFSPGDSQRYSEWAGFALAAIMTLAGCVAAIVARRASRREPAHKFVGYAIRAGYWINAGSLGLIAFIVFVLGGKW